MTYIFTELYMILMHLLFPPEVPVNLPPETVEGYLANGVHYIILPNEIPQHNVECRLVMHIGSIQEDDNQRGAAHFLEHMAFNGSEHFPGNSMVEYFENQGMKYGRDINAYTSYDRTIYWFSLPVDAHSINIVDTTLMAMGDIINGLTIDKEQVIAERNVIAEELHDYNNNDEFYDLKIGNGLYAAHEPLGREADIMSMRQSTLRGFYDRWYSPSTATILIVGNVDATLTERKIKKMLSDIPKKKVRIKNIPQEYPEGVELMTLPNKYDYNYKLELIVPHNAIFTSSLAKQIENERQRITASILDHRMQDIGGSATDHWYVADKNHLVFTMSDTTEHELLLDVRRTSNILRTLAKYGPTDTELKRAVAQGIRHVNTEPTDKASADYCEDFIDAVILGDRHVYYDYESDFIQKKLLKTSKRHIRRIAKSLLKASESLLAAYKYPKDGTHNLSEDSILSAWNGGGAIKGYEAVIADSVIFTNDVHDSGKDKIQIPPILNEHHPNIESVESRNEYEELHITEVILKNGIRIIMRPNTLTDSVVQIFALGRGGLGDLPDSLYNHLKDAVSYVDMGGISTINSDTLAEICLQRELLMNIGISNYWHQVLVTAPSTEIQTVMNLLYEKMHHPGKDEADFEESRQAEYDSWGEETVLSKMMQADYSRQVNNTVDSLVGSAVYGQFIPYTREDIQKLNLDDMTDFYLQTFTNPKGLNLIITGCFDVDSVVQLAANTFGRMQVNDKFKYPLKERPGQFTHPADSLIHFSSDNDKQTNCNFIFIDNYTPGLRQTLMFKLMRDILQARMLSELRQKSGMVYSPFADVNYNGVPRRIVWFRLYIDVQNENVTRMEKQMQDIIDDLGRNPVTDAELDKMKRSFIVTKRKSLADDSSGEWLDVILDRITNGETFSDYNQYDDVLNTITPEDIRDMFTKIINKNNLIKIYQSK